jgi:CRP/FNR family transcriptional regulator, cyclic AMP receptor protein
MPLLEEFLLDTPWVKLLKAGHRDRLLAETRERTVKRGAMFCQTGQRVEYWKGVIEGLVKVSVASAEGRTSTLTGLANGAWFGEGPVLRANTWDFDGVAMRETRIALVPRVTFEWLMDVSPEFNRFLIAQLNERLAQYVSIIEAERLELAETRAWLFNPVLYPNTGSRLELSQQEIGYLAGVPRQRVNQAFKLMSEAGLISVRYGAIEVLDLPALEKFKVSLAQTTLKTAISNSSKNLIPID